MTTKQKHPVLFIVGPTGAGKSALAIELAKKFRGEIINADSRQLYQHMNIGTAKPSPAEQNEVPHHLYDVAPPADPIGLARYLDLARPVIVGVQSRDTLPIIVGGAGQYVRALQEGWDAPAVPPDLEFRTKLDKEATEYGPARLYERLKALDPDAAAIIAPQNVRRVIRALEVYISTGKQFSATKSKAAPPFRALTIGLHTQPRQAIHERIDARVDAMMAAGWLNEVKWLLHNKYTESAVFTDSMGYPELLQVLTGDLIEEEAVRSAKAAHHRLVTYQHKWFRLNDPSIHWLVVGDGAAHAAQQLVAEFLAHKGT